MGQYYKYLVIDRNNTPHTASSWAYDNGAKLMEHSYIGNNYVNSALDLIYFNPCKVAWVGDYSTDGSCVENGKAEDFNQFYDMCWGSYDEQTETEIPAKIKEDEPVNEEDIIQFKVEDCKYFLINHSKHIYVDIEKYVNNNKWHEEGSWNNADGSIEHYSYDMCINLLPLLTACGNGQGGGDYRSNVGIADVGSWALDVIELADDKPFGYEEVEFSFKE